MSQSIEAVVFDLDGVITDTAHYHFLAWKALADNLGIQIDETFNERLKGISRIDSLKIILEHGNQLHDFTEDELNEMAEKKNRDYCEYLKGITKEDVLPGILSLLESIKTERIPIGLASVSKNASTVLKALGVEDAFDYCVDAAAVKKSKPDPEIFLTACKGLNAKPEKSIGIEDAIAGIASIKGSKMFAVGVGTALEQADFQVQTTNQLKWEEIKKHYENWANYSV